MSTDVTTANGMCDYICTLLAEDQLSRDSETLTNIEVVNNNVTVDSVVEHEVDLDVIHDDYIWNVCISVNRFYRKSSYDAEQGNEGGP